MGIYNANLEFLSKKSASVYKVITESKPMFENSIYLVEEQLNFIVEGNNSRCFIHSLYDSDRELKEMFKYINDKTEVMVLFGFGCGNAIRYISQNLTNIKIVYVVEPDLKLFQTVLQYVEINSLGELKIGFILNEDKVRATEMLKEVVSSNSNIGIVYHLYFRTLYGGYFEFVNNTLIKCLHNIRVNLATEYTFTRLWTQNTIKNIRQISIPAERLFDQLKGMPAILVSAGPSLNKNVHLLDKARDKAIIVAVGSAIGVLDRNGIIPHLRVAIDAEDTEQRIFDDIKESAVPLIYSDILYQEIVPNYPGPTYKMIMDLNYITKYIYKQCEISFLPIRAGFSVANVAFDMLCKLGCSKIIMMGQDLCFTGRKYYADGAWVEAEIDISSDKFIKTTDCYGQQVYTQKSFLGMRNIFEQLIKENEKIEVINASEGGLVIEGAVNRKLIEVIDEMEESINIEGIVNRTSKEFDTQKYSNKIENSILLMEGEILRIDHINANRYERLKAIHECIEMNSNNKELLDELRSIEKIESELKEISFYKEVIEPTLSRIFASIALSFNYRGNDPNRLLKAKNKVLWGYTTELDSYVSLLKELIKQNKN